MQEIIQYIIKLLLQGNEHLAEDVCYASNPNEYGNSRVIIRSSGFFEADDYGQKNSLPAFPLKKIDDIVFLYGNDFIEHKDGRIFVEADIIASAFFFLARYEEWVDNECFDEHNRFIGKKSLQFRAGVLNRPIVDEYGVLLRKWLRNTGLEVKEPAAEFSKIYLTHDIDTLTQYRHFRGFLGGICRGKFISVIKSLSNINKDIAFDFDWIIKQDLRVKNAEKIFFVKAAENNLGYNYPQYNLTGKDFKFLKNMLDKNNCKIGIHSGYYAYDKKQIFDNEADRLETILGRNVYYNRHHFLRIVPPAMPEYFTISGITDDFSVAFADMAGFRLGTCRAFNRINPETLKIEPVVLHPLTLMDITLSNYMGMNYEQALETAKNIILQTKKFGGEIVTLWHNSLTNTGSYHKKLYEKIINYINSLQA